MTPVSESRWSGEAKYRACAGHEKGAFTGALERRRGRFELGAGGPIFLDEGR